VLKAELLPGPLAVPQTPPVGRGDNIRLARAASARLGALDEAWYLPGMLAPGVAPYEGRDVAVTMVTERMVPHTVWVNRAGERFVNESSQNAANALYVRDARGQQANLPAYCVFDGQFRERYRLFLNVAPGQPDPPGVSSAPNLEELARRIGVDIAGLSRTVASFNRMVRSGRDEQFARGEGAYERFLGDGRAPHPNLGTVEKPPFYAFQLLTSGVGTKGGALTDRDGRTMREDGAPIPGLYAAGNACAAFNGPLTVAAGCTIGPALVMGRQAARHACA
jgi:3-oxosteroid 1-dehydrogenase